MKIINQRIISICLLVFMISFLGCIKLASRNLIKYKYAYEITQGNFREIINYFKTRIELSIRNLLRTI